MEEPDLQKRVSDLEQEVNTLKKSLKADAEPLGIGARSQNLARFLIANWVLLSFVSALLIAGYVKITFGIDYFESYRNTAANRELEIVSLARHHGTLIVHDFAYADLGFDGYKPP